MNVSLTANAESAAVKSEIDGVINAKRFENGIMYMTINGREYRVNSSEFIFFDVLDVGKLVRITVENDTIVRIRPQSVKPAVITAAEIKKEQQQSQQTSPQQTTTTTSASAQKPAAGQDKGPSPGHIPQPSASGQGTAKPAPIPSVMENVAPPTGRPLTIPDIGILRVAADVVLASDGAPASGDVDEVIRKRTLRIWQVADWLKSWVNIVEVRK